jgi:hypothetical protein
LDDQLSDPVATSNAHRLSLVGVDQADLDLAAIALIHGARSVHNADAVPSGQSGARVHEGRVAGRQRDGHTGSDQPPLSWPELEIFSAAQIRPRITGVGI